MTKSNGELYYQLQQFSGIKEFIPVSYTHLDVYKRQADTDGNDLISIDDATMVQKRLAGFAIEF